MKVISIWNPWASLIVHGFKFIETRSWPAPKTVIGQRIGIASTKSVLPIQKEAFVDSKFQDFYYLSGLPDLQKLPNGYLLGTAILDSVDLMDQALVNDITEEERAFGFYALGRYAWRLRKPEPLSHPIPIQGKQGLFDFAGFDHEVDRGETRKAEIQNPQERASNLRGVLPFTKR
ncbi:MAG: ASCH domain-containing protein [Undibacterium sp.]